MERKTKTRKRRRRGLSGTSHSGGALSLKKVVNEAKTPALIIGGIFLGTQIGNLIDKQVTPTVSGLLGLDGASSKFIKPVILGAGGLITAAVTKNPTVRLVSYGVATSGGIMLAKSMNVNVLPLSGADYDPRVIVPGMGDPNLPALEPISGYDSYTIAGEDDDYQIAGDEDYAMAGDEERPIA